MQKLAQSARIEEARRGAENISWFSRNLVGFDGSPQSEKAVDAAFVLAQTMGSKVLVLAVARPPEPATMVEVDAMIDDARQHFEEHFKGITSRAKELGVELQTSIAVGHPVEQIVHRAEIEHIDLIILGRRGMSRSMRIAGW